MFKRMLSLLLALVTALTLLPPVRQVQAATEADFTDIIATAYDKYAASVRQPDAANKAIDQLLEPAIYGKGKTLTFGKNDVFTAALYESNLFRTFFIRAVSSGIASMQDHHLTRLMVSGGCSWYDESQSYSVHHYADEDYGKTITEDLPYYKIVTDYTALKTAPNESDNAMILVVGTSSVRVLMEQTALSAEAATYHVSVRLTDRFDYGSNDYSGMEQMGFSSAFAKLLNLMGALLRLKTFDWGCETELTVTVPNTCTHSGDGKYRWEKVDGALVNVTGEDFLENGLTRKTATQFTGSTFVETNHHYYKLDRGIDLRHNAPWYIEFKLPATSVLYLGPETNYGYTRLPQFYKSTTRFSALETQKVRKRNPSTGKDGFSNNMHMYGVHYVNAGAPKSGLCVYRIENRIAPDGTNSLWLLVDGVELGTLSQYVVYDAYDSKNYAKGEDPHWTNGKDFIIRHIFNSVFYFTETMPLVYLEIDTAGGYQVTEETPASCTQGAGSVTNCVLCGAVVAKSNEEAPGHTPKTVPGKAATCTEAGLTEGSVCAVCGETLQEQAELPPLSHEEKNLPGKAPTCLEAGLTEGSACALCGELLVSQQPLPALSHSLEKGKCVRCGYLDYLPGDVNADGILDYQDALTVLRVSIGLEINDSPACDMNGDGNINYSDALMILRTSIGLE